MGKKNTGVPTLQANVGNSKVSEVEAGCRVGALDLLRQSAKDSELWKLILASPSVAQFTRRSLTAKASSDPAFAKQLFMTAMTGADVASVKAWTAAAREGSAASCCPSSRSAKVRRRLCIKQGEVARAGPSVPRELPEPDCRSQSSRKVRRRLVFKQSVACFPSKVIGPLNLDLVASIFSFVEVHSKVTAVRVVSLGCQEACEQHTAWDPLKLDKELGRKLLRTLKMKDVLGYFAEDCDRTKRSFPSGFFDIRCLEFALMDPERIEPAQSDTEDDTPKPQTLIPDPLDEILKRLRYYFSKVTALTITNIEDYRMDYRFVGLRCTSLVPFGFVQLQHNSNPGTYELRALRDEPPNTIDLKAAKSLNSSRVPWAVRARENTTISEREALFLQEHLGAFKNGNEFFLTHAIYRSIPSHAVRKRYKAVEASLRERFPQQFHGEMSHSRTP